MPPIALKYDGVLCGPAIVQGAPVAVCNMSHFVTSVQRTYAVAPVQVVQVLVMNTDAAGVAITSANFVSGAVVVVDAVPNTVQFRLSSQPLHAVRVYFAYVPSGQSNVSDVVVANTSVVISPSQWDTPLTILLSPLHKAMLAQVRHWLRWTHWTC